MSKFQSRTPDYKLKALDKLTGVKSQKIGAAWKNEDQSISIQIDPFVVLTHNLSLTLFVWNAPEKEEQT